LSERDADHERVLEELKVQFDEDIEEVRQQLIALRELKRMERG
jgi:hypothetical protein